MKKEIKQELNVAYLSSEIPSVSTTFIYNEILGLEKKGINISIYSVNYPAALAEENDAKKIFERTEYLYSNPNYTFIIYTFFQFFKNFKNFAKVTFYLISDIISIKIFTIDSIKLIYHFLVSNYLAYKLKANKIQHLHIHFAHVPTQIGMYAAELCGIPFTFTAHANDIFQRKLLLQKKANRAKKLITISDYNKNFLVSKGIDAKKIQIVRCGVATSNKISSPKKSPIPIIGSLGRLVEKKGMDDLIKACKLLKNDSIEFKLEIAGNGPLHNYLKQLTYDYGIDDLVDFKGVLRHDIVFDWLKKIDVFALACKRDKYGDADGIPVVLMEAMAFNIPVVTTSISGVPELVEHEKTGLLSPPNNSNMLYENLKRILTDENLRKRLIHNAKKWIELEFNEDININRLYNIISETNPIKSDVKID